MILSQSERADLGEEAGAPVSHRPELVRLAKGTALVFAATVFGLGLTYVYNIFLARYFGAGVYGLYALGLAVFNLLSVIALAGLDSATLKFVPECAAAGDEPGLRRTVRTILGLALAFGGLLGAALLLVSDTLAVEILQQPETAHVLRILALGIPAYTVSSVLLSTLQAFQGVRWRTLVKYVSEPVTKIILAVVLVWTGWDLDAALIAFVSALILSTVLAWVPLRYVWSRRKMQPASRVSAGSILTYSTPLLGALLVESIATKADILFLGYWRSVSEVGIYSAAFQTSAIIVLVLQSFESIANPFLSQSIAQDDRTRLDKLYKIVLRWVLTFSLPIFLVMALLPKDMLALFGKNFEGGALCLVILAVGQILNAGTGSANNVLLLSGYTRWVMWNGLLVGILQIALNLILIPGYGIIGAAVAASMSLVLVNILRVVEGYVLLGIQPYEWGILKPIAAGVGTSLVVLLLRQWLQGQGLFPFVCVVVLSYFTLLAALGPDDDDTAVLCEVGRRVRRIGGLIG